jgi:hypothetical protein
MEREDELTAFIPVDRAIALGRSGGRVARSGTFPAARDVEYVVDG